ncbi:septal ring lytic transglycosylase RlpA family protein [Brevundimonas sp.]|uniref:septal ring lytic transglycosylase RlpA family protein n=1 Tax=Brevundimonas sp. TaxID=1871086 RepID=UPI001202543E|nr:septal ring lytic transglycosylase RlpA family protein [Brevundimonas sp.]TAJ64941.1 MAG: septal ring lytic transglycosylase RlpA family protein [Brevundimonas sp.]
MSSAILPAVKGGVMAGYLRTKALRSLLAVGLLSLLAACAVGVRPEATRLPVVTDPAPIVSGTMRAYQVRGRWYRPAEQPGYDETGMASWYGDQFNGRPTATGERFDMHALTAAHKTLPLPGLVEVTNLANGRRIVVRVNDRGPFVDNRIIDLSRGAADALGMLQAGVGEVRVRYLGRAPRAGGGTTLQYAAADERSREPAARPLSAGAAYWIQAGAFSDRRAARRVADQLGDRATVDGDRNDGLFRVLVGPWPDPNAAERSRQAVIARGYADALLISAR